MQMKYKQEIDLEVQRSGERNSAANLLTRVFIKHTRERRVRVDESCSMRS